MTLPDAVPLSVTKTAGEIAATLPLVYPEPLETVDGVPTHDAVAEEMGFALRHKDIPPLRLEPHPILDAPYTGVLAEWFIVAEARSREPEIEALIGLVETPVNQAPNAIEPGRSLKPLPASPASEVMPTVADMAVAPIIAPDLDPVIEEPVTVETPQRLVPIIPPVAAPVDNEPVQRSVLRLVPTVVPFEGTDEVEVTAPDVVAPDIEPVIATLPEPTIVAPESTPDPAVVGAPTEGFEIVAPEAVGAFEVPTDAPFIRQSVQPTSSDDNDPPTGHDAAV